MMDLRLGICSVSRLMKENVNIRDERTVGEELEVLRFYVMLNTTRENLSSTICVT
jgi:hypothetical protein